MGFSIYGIYFLAAQRLVTAFAPPHPSPSFFPLELNLSFRQNPSEAFHQVKEGLGGVLLQRRLNAEEKGDILERWAQLP